MTNKHVVGVDVGTGSLRAAVFTTKGEMLGHASATLNEWSEASGIYEQSSDQLWDACGSCVKEAIASSGIAADTVVGIGFDATCSLVLLGDGDASVTVSLSGDDARNIIEWRDHRAVDEADIINGGGHECLKYVGGKMSPEQQPPKLKWIKDKLPASWQRARKAFDLSDFMVYKACGRDARSVCTVGCKWGFLAHECRWDTDMYRKIGIDDAIERGMCGHDVLPLGACAGVVTEGAASHLGVPAGCKVSVGIIDAHSGGVGLAVSDTTLALITGTSSCHMITSRDPIFVEGVWGPYFGAQLPGKWLSEGGQSATGALLDHTIERFGLIKRDGRLEHVTEEKSMHQVYLELNSSIEARAQREGCALCTIAKKIHVLPEHHGNRSPYADAAARGCIDGLTLDMSTDSLSEVYLATVQAVAYGTRHIIDTLEAAGHTVERVAVCGGGAKNSIWLQQHADALQRPLVLSQEPEAVLLGAAILAAVAGGQYQTVEDATKSMCRPGRVVEPEASTRGYHEAKFQHQMAMYRQQLARRMA